MAYRAEWRRYSALVQRDSKGNKRTSTALAALHITFVPQNRQRQPSRSKIESCSVGVGIRVGSRAALGRHFGRFTILCTAEESGPTSSRAYPMISGKSAATNSFPARSTRDWSRASAVASSSFAANSNSGMGFSKHRLIFLSHGGPMNIFRAHERLVSSFFSRRHRSLYAEEQNLSVRHAPPNPLGLPEVGRSLNELSGTGFLVDKFVLDPPAGH